MNTKGRLQQLGRQVKYSENGVEEEQEGLKRKDVV